VNAANYPRMTTSRLLAAYAGDIRFELVKMLRTPAFAVPTLVFPAMFYILFGVIMGKGDPVAGLGTYARLGVFGTMAPGLFGFGVSLAFEREYGLLRFKQALPMPTGAYLIARMSMAMLFAAIIAALLATIAFTVAHAPLTVGAAARVALIEILGVLPFCAIGLFVGASVSGQAAPAVINLIYLPMAFLSGLWVPLQFLPKILQELGPIWPSYHLQHLALNAVGQSTTGTTSSHIAALAGITLLFFWLALRRLGNSNVRLIGGTRANTASPLRRLTSVAVPALAAAGIVIGLLGAKSPAASANSADGAAAATASSDSKPAPAGGPTADAAPADGLLANFDSGSANATYGLGFAASNDKFVGGESTSSVKVIDGGANGSHGALEVTGMVKAGFIWPFAGAGFFPKDPPNRGMLDYSKFKTLSFWVRGDGKHYTCSIFSTADQNTPPSSFPFEAGPVWKQVRVPLADYVVDLTRVRGIMFVDNTADDTFKFEIDNVRFE
jgi:ABC-2 type transport system permease protein